MESDKLTEVQIRLTAQRQVLAEMIAAASAGSGRGGEGSVRAGAQSG